MMPREMHEALRLGIDLGGTKIEGVVLHLGSDEPQVVSRVRMPTEQEQGYDHVVSQTAKVIAEVTREAGLQTPPPIGVGMPGSVTYRKADGTLSTDHLVKNSNTVCLTGRAFHRDLSTAVGSSIAFANDANCFALAETMFGAGRGARVSFGVILGTGVGGGVVLRDDRGELQAWNGAQGIAGEWGHVSLHPIDGPPCYCGRRGCIERYLSGPAIEAAYAERSGVPRSLREIAAARATDLAAQDTLAHVTAVFGRAIATVINILDPDVVVLGGGVSNLEIFYQEGLAEVAKWVFNDELWTKIVKNTLGDSAGVLGAALLPASNQETFGKRSF
ncbi:MAG: ROK family protein [Polyangiales bacterium]